MLLEMKNIRKTFGPIEVLHGVDFTVKRGEIHALVGHNGAGKSTLMKVLGGNFSDYGGDISIEGKPLILNSPGAAIAEGVAMIYQDFSLIPDMTVAENIALGREPAGISNALVNHRALRERSAEEASALDIDLPMDSPVRKLGVAGQQLTEIVRACSRKIKILVMDEPTARLAPAEREHLFRVMRNMAQNHGVGIVYISHFLDEVINVADRITVLRDGSVVESRDSRDYTVESLSRLLVDKDDLEAPAKHEAPLALKDDAVFEIKDLTFPGRSAFSLTVNSGEILGIAGLIGSGRTRIARAIVGDLQSKGSVRVADTTLHSRTPRTSARAGLVMVPEDRKISGLAPNASIEANMAVTAINRLLAFSGFVSLGKRRAFAEKYISDFGIRPPDPTQRVNRLSGGNAQKVLVARALAARPKVLILDQPTAGVDVGAKADLHGLVRLATEEGATVVLISDELEELIGLSDRIAVISEGKIQPPRPASEFTPASLLAAMSHGARREETELQAS
ncbi:sugar ABC transporter ATP-binding protein [Martelella soudanensis]|uniref:sugar ABC transporter ATP-binding protein n=1 Tax=unclassified Martelella TaxID=2629616 RepID=UPI0015DF3178|nr:MULTISPECIES: sugar ABC transporter ATP-binding protein [unclassified Martelella]